MPLTEPGIVAFYDGCDYWPVKDWYRRPDEVNIPITIWWNRDTDSFRRACEAASGESLALLTIEPEDCKALSAVLLHESLFHFYKAFYNYLAARALYYGGMEHWINVTLYYARFFLAESVTVLTGKHWYYVTKDERGFVPQIAEALRGSKGRPPDSYRLRLEVDLVQRTGRVTADKGRVSSHRDVWQDYRESNPRGLGLRSLLYSAEGQKDSIIGIPKDYLVKARNRENYSFEGYGQLDFNLPLDAYMRNISDCGYAKARADTLYDQESGDVLLAWSSQFRLYKKLNVVQLPIEDRRFSYLIGFCLPDSKAKESLLQLCAEGFPTRNLYSEDGETFFDEKDRVL